MTGIEWHDDMPYSTEFDDVYYSAEGGLAESQHVYLQGIDLKGLANVEQSTVRVGELGFGTGVNFLATAQFWLEHAQSRVLHYCAVEKYPLSVAEMQRAHKAFPQITDLSLRLKQVFTTRLSGMQRCWFAPNILLDIWCGDVSEILPQISGGFDGWYMDGFSPKKNPEMFSLPVCTHLARLSRPCARVASFSVAGVVRRNLAQSGFEVEKVTGFGRKGQCLVAVKNRQKDDNLSISPQRKIAIIGVGIAGASCADQCARLGHRVDVFADSATGTASHVPIAAVAARLSATVSPRGSAMAAAYAFAVQYYQQYPQAIVARGAMKVPSRAFSIERLHGATESWKALGDHAPKICSENTARRLSQVEIDSDAQYLPSALCLDTAQLFSALLASSTQHRIGTVSYRRDGAHWQIYNDSGACYSGYDALILACGAGLSALMPQYDDCTWVKSSKNTYYHSNKPPKMALGGWGGHISPAQEGFWLGESAQKMDILQRFSLSYSRQGETWSGNKLSVRGHWPLCTAVPDQQGLFVLAGAGGHGFTLMPLLASHLALMQDGYNR